MAAGVAAGMVGPGSAEAFVGAGDVEGDLGAGVNGPSAALGGGVGAIGFGAGLREVRASGVGWEGAGCVGTARWPGSGGRLGGASPIASAHPSSITPTNAAR